LAKSLAVTSALIVTGTEQLKGAQSDAKKLSPLQAKPVLKSVNYSSMKLSGEEIAFQLKIINNLIATIKSSENL
jgi:hypothetical protein